MRKHSKIAFLAPMFWALNNAIDADPTIFILCLTLCIMALMYAATALNQKD